MQSVESVASIEPAKPHSTILISLAGAGLLFQLVPNLLGGYGYFIDELYYIACARRLDFGYVDHPPFAPFMLRVWTSLLGESLGAIRLLSAVTGAGVVYLAGWLAAFLGGGRWAQTVSGIAAMLAPVHLVFFDSFSMNGFEVVFWTAALAIVLIMVRKDEPKLWLAFGAVCGVGLQNKHTMVLLGVAVVIGMLLSPTRKLLWSKWLWLGGLVAFVLVLPNVLWQVAHDWPSLEFYRNATVLKNLPSPPLRTLMNQVLSMNPILFPLWSAGLLFLVTRDRRYRVTAWTYFVLLGVLVVSQSSRPDRIVGAYTTLFAAGAVWWEGFFANRLRGLRWAFLSIVAAGCLALVPMFLPILPPARTADFVAFIGIDTQMERGEGKRAQLPQWLADRFGWEELVSLVDEVYRELPKEERERTLILAPSYGHAGALELLGAPIGLPAVISPHNTYHLWGRATVDRMPGSTVIAIGWDPRALEENFRDVEEVAIYTCDFCMNWRNDMRIHVARQFQLDALESKEAWEGIKHYE